MSAIDRLRDGYTAGASDPSAAHDEFDRLVRLAGLDADHAVALEREAIAAWLERICDDILHHAQKADDAGEVEASRAAFIDLSIRRAEVQEIRNGDHWRVER